MSTVGALFSLLRSTFSVKAGCSELELYWDDDADVLNADHGTGTSFPLELRLPAVASEALMLELSVVELDSLEFSDSKAKSILPELALIITSWIVPTFWPAESFTRAPVSLLARTDFSVLRPVAVKCLVLQLRFADESLDCVSCDCVCDCAQPDAAIEHAAQRIVIFKNVFFITFFVAVWFRKKIDTDQRRFETIKPRLL
jgi:hypothetical protein